MSSPERVEEIRFKRIEGHCSTHEGSPFWDDTRDGSAFCALCEFEEMEAALAQAERELAFYRKVGSRSAHSGCWQTLDTAQAEVARLKSITYPTPLERQLQAEVERLKGEAQGYRENAAHVITHLEADLARVRAALEDFEHEMELDRSTIVNNVPIPLNVSILRLWDRLRAALEGR